MLIDPFGRTIDYLRISLTDRCNFHCVYCDPRTELTERRARDPRGFLDTDAFVRVARIAATLGVRKVKLTGGEPLLYRDLVALVGRLAGTPGILDLSITTNGSRLEPLARPLHDAGLRRLNLSVDSLRPERFFRMTHGGDLGATLRAFELARELGYRVKINVVALEGWNADELDDFVRFAETEDAEVRFIEFMPLCGPGWSPGLFVSATAMRERIRRHHALEPLEGDGVAMRFATARGGRIGFITTMSDPFCDGCRRLRLTAWGALRPCLFSAREVDLRPLLVDGGDRDSAIAEALRHAVAMKPERNEVLAGVEDPRRLEIRSVGG
ncbi:MAG: GTP 3',8-cyclase MoaA [Hyphomicrobiales bacterium]